MTTGSPLLIPPCTPPERLDAVRGEKAKLGDMVVALEGQKAKGMEQRLERAFEAEFANREWVHFDTIMAGILMIGMGACLMIEIIGSIT